MYTVDKLTAPGGKTLGYSINGKTVPVQELREYIDDKGAPFGTFYVPGKNCLRKGKTVIGTRRLSGRYRFSITGELGSGKSSICKELRRKTGVSVYSAGRLLREMAASSGVSIERMNMIADADRTIDAQIDARMAGLSELPGLFIVDARLGWHFVRDTYKIYTYADKHVGALRVAGDNGRLSESYGDARRALEKLEIRQKLELERFKSIYNIDYLDMRNYDLVIDTTDMTAEEAALFVAERYENGGGGAFLSKYSLYPTKDARDLGDLTAFASGADKHYTPPKAARGPDNRYYIIDGHRRIASAIQNGEKLIRVQLVKDSDLEAYRTIAGYEDSFRRAWEDALGFKFYE